MTRTGRWTRSKFAAALTIASVVALGSFAQPSAARQGEVGNGTAKATAVVAKVAPGVGALELGVTSGVAVAEITNSLAQSQSQALDLGLIGTTLTADGCREATIGADDLPQPLRVDNRNGDAVEQRDEFPLAGTVLGAGRLRSEAKTTPSSNASASGVGFAIDPLLRFDGGHAMAETEVLPGAGRLARASVDTSIDIAGVVRLEGMRWEAFHRTGDERVVEGSFSIAAAEVGGIPFPGDELEPVEAAANTLLAFSGVTIEFPEVERFEAPTDLVRVTPMRIVLRDSPAGGLLLGPGLNASREQREQLFDELTAAFCDAAGALLVGDITISVISGTGFLAFEIGGAEAISGDFVQGDAIDIPAPPAAPPPPPADAPGAPGPSDGSAIVPPSTDGDAGGEQAAESLTPSPAADVGPLERVCESIHPFDWPSCSRGAAPLAGLIGVAGTAAMFGLDLRRQRSLEVSVDEVVS